MTDVLTEPMTAVITDGAPNTVTVQRDLKYELAATYSRVLELKNERKDLSARIGELDERMQEIVSEIKQGGTQLAMNFGTTTAAENDEPQEEPDDDVVSEYEGPDDEASEH